MTTKDVGNALEDIVALLHTMPSVSVQTRVNVPTFRSRPGAEDTREIDVLVSHDVVGYPVRIAFECKNEKKHIGIERIDAFLSKLQDIGVHPTQGIFVSASGYTEGATRRGREEGMRLLVMEGLNEERLAAAVNDALFALVFYVLSVDAWGEFAFLPPRASNSEPWPDGLEANFQTVHDAAWQLWVRGKFPATIGRHHFLLRETDGRAIFIDCRVRAYVGSVVGTGRHVALRNTTTSAVERARLETDFQVPNSVDLQVFTTEDELNQFETDAANARHLVARRIRVPRLITEVLFWPPSRDAVRKIRELRNAGVEVTFANVEGHDLSAAWANFESQRG